MTCTQAALGLTMLLASLAFPVACGTSDDSGTSGTSADEGSSAVDCAALDITTCASTEACSLLDGGMLEWPDTGGTACFTVGANDAVGCISADTGCGAAVTYATASEKDVCYQFSSTCVPDGWIACSPDPDTVGECP